jgi:transcriptional regulator with XRE-family HTH domain
MVRISAPVKHPYRADICVIGQRLKEERERLQMTLPAFAEAAGAQKRTAIDWQNGASSPTAAQLASLAAIGVDIRYVITGERITPSERELQRRLNAVADATRRAMEIPGLSREQQHSVQEAIFEASVRSLAPDEQELIHHYRLASPAVRPAIMAAAASLAGAIANAQPPPKEKPSRQAKVQQNFHAEVGQVVGHKIVNKGRKTP